MKKILSLLLLLMMVVTCFTGCTKKPVISTLDKIKQRDKIVIGTKFDSKPFGYVDGQELKGFEIDFGRKIAKELLGDENKVEFKQVLSSNRILALSSGEVDMLIATVSITDQRAKVIDFSEPYFTTGLAILKQKDSNIKTITDLNKRPVLYVLGTTGEKEIKILAPDADTYGFRSYTDAYSALKAGRAEAMITDKSILMGIALNDPNYILLPKTYTTEHYGIGFKKGEASATLKAEINKIIETFMNNGEFDKLMKKWGIPNV